MFFLHSGQPLASRLELMLGGGDSADALDTLDQARALRCSALAAMPVHHSSRR